MNEFIEPIKCAFCSVNSNTIFRNLNSEESDKLEASKICNYYKKGDIIYNENSKIKGAYCVSSGIVKIYKTGIDGKEQIVAFAKKGDIIGYRSTLSGELACTTTKVLEDAEICFIPIDILISFIKTNGAFALELIQFTCKELGKPTTF